MSVDRKQVRKQLEAWLAGDEFAIPSPKDLARHCLAVLAELEQAEAAWPRLDHWRERAQVAEARLAKVPALVEALKRIADPTELTGDGVLEEMAGPAAHELWARIGRAEKALTEWERE